MSTDKKKDADDIRSFKSYLKQAKSSESNKWYGDASLSYQTAARIAEENLGQKAIAKRLYGKAAENLEKHNPVENTSRRNYYLSPEHTVFLFELAGNHKKAAEIAEKYAKNMPEDYGGPDGQRARFLMMSAAQEYESSNNHRRAAEIFVEGTPSGRRNLRKIRDYKALAEAYDQTIEMKNGQIDYLHNNIENPRVQQLWKETMSAEKLSKKLRKKLVDSGLERTVETTAVIGILGGLFFLSSNFTGNVISNFTNSTTSRVGLSQTSSTLVGIILVIIGLIFAFVHFRNN